MYEVTELIRDDTLREPFLDKVIPIIFSSDENPFHITDFEIQNEYLLYWADEFSKTESFLDNIEDRKEKSKYRTTYQPLERKSQDRIKQIQGIVESLDTFLAGVCDQFYVNYFKLLESNYSLL
jgi:hypothetical protein